MNLVKSSVIYFSGELLSKSIPFLMLPYLTRQLGLEGFGELSYFLVIFALSYVLISISQDGALGRYFFRYGQSAINSVISSGYSYSILVSLLIILLLYLLNFEVYITTILFALTQTIVASQLSLKQCHKEAFNYTLLQSLVSLSASFLTVVAFEYIDSSVATRINCLFIGNICALLIFFNFKLLPLKQTFNLFSPTWLHFRYILTFGLPLIIHQFSFWGKGQFDRFLIIKEFDSSQLGLYSAAFQISSIIMIILFAINKAIVPVLYQKIKDKLIGPKEILFLAFGSLLLVPIPSLLAWLLPESLYLFVLGEEFLGAKYFVVMFSFGLMMHLPYQFLANYFFYHGRNSLVAMVTFLSVMIHIAIVILMAKVSRLDLIPYALIVSNTFVLISLFLSVKFLHPINQLKG